MTTVATISAVRATKRFSVTSKKGDHSIASISAMTSDSAVVNESGGLNETKTIKKNQPLHQFSVFSVKQAVLTVVQM